MSDEAIDPGSISIVERRDIDILYLEVADDPGEMAVAWEHLEAVLESLTGRHGGAARRARARPQRG